MAQTTADIRGLGGGKSPADHSEVRGGTDWARPPVAQTAETSRPTVFWRDGDWRCEASLA